ncbi:hypothetical protein GCM10023196_102900 [Actinoallomurus vinaceus]|uniref:Uncharacterized protein n=1 Tax=Actinoallomurus vinaceus TaxID=1080074 RepID=A0ABP8UXH3_9ACTN
MHPAPARGRRRIRKVRWDSSDVKCSMGKSRKVNDPGRKLSCRDRRGTRSDTPDLTDETGISRGPARPGRPPYVEGRRRRRPHAATQRDDARRRRDAPGGSIVVPHPGGSAVVTRPGDPAPETGAVLCARSLHLVEST